MVETPIFASLLDRSAGRGWLAALAQAKHRLADADNGDGDGNPTQQQNSEIDGGEQQRAERHAAAIDMDYR